MENSKHAIEKIKDYFISEVKDIDITDGLGMDFDNWRFNLRTSNTEPVISLNVEAKGNKKLMEEKTQHILSLLQL